MADTVGVARATEHPATDQIAAGESNSMLVVDNLVKTFGTRYGRRRNVRGEDAHQVLAVAGATFEVGQGELFTLLGPSGCGKTTILRSIAGLERPDQGLVRVDGRVFFDSARGLSVPANRRRLGMVFQSYAIWPHMSVAQNAAFPLEVLPRRQRPSRRDIEHRVRTVLDVTELSRLADRPATKLSGGQQQRLALARALVIEPRLLLLDEPLSNLDAKLREAMRFELKRLQRDLGLTTVYVTHDQAEALALSSRIAVMNAGRIVQVGKPREIYEHPNCRFVADFIGVTNFLGGRITAVDHGRFLVRTGDGELWVAVGADLPVGCEVTLSLRPECIGISTRSAGGTTPNEWRGTVVNRAFLGDSVDHVISVGRTELRNRSNPAQSIAPGTEVYLAIQPGQIVLVPA
jgi:iron(III) transport system ATP-binding protein